MSALTSNDTCDLVPPPLTGSIVGCRWIYHDKFDSKGHLEGYKCRFVAQVFSQLPGLDFDDTFSNVVKPATIHTILSIMISKHRPVHQLDVKNSFIHGDLSKEVYMKQPLAMYIPKKY